MPIRQTKMPPSCFHDAPKVSQDDPRHLQNLPNMLPRRPKTPPRRPKTSQDAPRRPPDPPKGRFWIDFGTILGRLWVDFWLNFYRINPESIGPVFVRFWCPTVSSILKSSRPCIKSHKTKRRAGGGDPPWGVTISWVCLQPHRPPRFP